MISVRELLLGVLAPALIALAIMLIAWRPWRSGPRRGEWGGAVGLAAGYICAHIGLAGPPRFTPAPVESWLVWIAIGGMAIGLIESRARGPWWGRLLWRAAATAGSVWLIVRLRVINEQWSVGEGLAWTAGLTVGALVFWTLADALAERIEREGGGAGAALVLSGITGLGAAIIVLDGQTLVVGQFSGALAVALLACAALAWWKPRVSIARGGVAVVGLLAPMLWLDAWMWAELHWEYAAALVLSPALAFVGDLAWINRRAGWARTLARVGAVVLPLLGIIGFEVKQAIDEEQSQRELGY